MTEERMRSDSVIHDYRYHRYAAWLVLLTIPALLMILTEYRHMGSFGHQTPDARVYISIADNYVSTGHFIQTERPVSGLVVPPGVPAILTLFRLLRFSNGMIIAIQILMFGLCNIMLYETECVINGKGIWAPIIYTMANMRCWICLGLFLVEHYYLFLLCFAVWTMYREYEERKKIVLLNLIGLAMVLIRPLLSPVYLTIIGYTLYWGVKNKNKKLTAALLFLPILAFSLNIMINYRETGEFILLENYSASDMYTASRQGSPIHIEEAQHFPDEVYMSIVNDESLNASERNAVFKKLTKENLRDHFGKYLKNGVLRGHEIFMKAYAWATIYTLIGGLMLACEERRKKNWRATVMLLLTLLLALLSSFGVSECRYSIVIWPMASLHGAYVTDQILRRLNNKIHNAIPERQ